MEKCYKISASTVENSKVWWTHVKKTVSWWEHKCGQLYIWEGKSGKNSGRPTFPIRIKPGI